MNTNHALHAGLRSLILVSLTVLASACGASPEGPSTAGDESVTEPAGDASDLDGAARINGTFPAPLPSLPPDNGSVPRDNGPGAPSGGGYAPKNHPSGGYTRS